LILLVDAGNSRIKWGIWSAGVWHGGGAFPLPEVDSIAAVVAEYRPAWAGVCCVANQETRARLARCLKPVPSHWLASAAQSHGIINRYEKPETLGADRYAGLIAAFRAGLAPCVVVSAGTALTVDALSGEGEFLGGMILPGIGLMRRALAEATAGVPALTGGWRDFPCSTGDAVETGVLTAAIGAIEAMQQRLTGALGCEPAVRITGGDAEILAVRISATVTLERNLVLEGLLWLARDLGVSGA
jgi:type III pantothenate kinase